MPVCRSDWPGSCKIHAKLSLFPDRKQRHVVKHVNKRKTRPVTCVCGLAAHVTCHMHECADSSACGYAAIVRSTSKYGNAFPVHLSVKLQNRRLGRRTGERRGRPQKLRIDKSLPSSSTAVLCHEGIPPRSRAALAAYSSPNLFYPVSCKLDIQCRPKHAFYTRSGCSYSQIADKFWVATLCQRRMLIQVGEKWYMVIGSTPCLVYASHLSITYCTNLLYQ